MLSGWSQLSEEKRSGWGGEMRWKKKGSIEKGEGAACFEVSPRWPEEVKSCVNLQINAQEERRKKENAICLLKRVVLLHTACDTLYWSYVCNLMVTFSERWKQSRRCKHFWELTFGCHMLNVICAWMILGSFCRLPWRLHVLSCLKHLQSWDLQFGVQVMYGPYFFTWSKRSEFCAFINNITRFTVNYPKYLYGLEWVKKYISCLPDHFFVLHGTIM